MTATTSPDDFDAFVDCEDAFLRLFDTYGLVLERRLRSRETATEVHIIRVPSEAALAGYLADPARTALLPRIRRLDVSQRIVRMDEVG